MVNRRNQWCRMSTELKIQGAVTTLSLALLLLTNVDLLAQDESPSASQGPCGSCPYLCINRQCVNADKVQPLDFSACAPVSAHYVCIDNKTSKIFVATPEQYKAKSITPDDLEQFKKDAATNNSINE